MGRGRSTEGPRSPRGTLGSCSRLYPQEPGLQRHRPQAFIGCAVPIQNPSQPSRPRLFFFFPLPKRGYTPPSTTTTPVSLFPQPPGLNQLHRLANKVRVWFGGGGSAGGGPRGARGGGGAAGREARQPDWRAVASQVHLGLCRCERLCAADKWGEDEEVGTRAT